MDREIKFRGKRKDNGEWAEGCLIDTKVGCFIAPKEWFEDPHRTAIYDDEIYPISIDIDVYAVDPATVGQFTGLKDKNGKEIYEGDIVRWQSKTNESFESGKIGAIVWNSCGFWHIEGNAHNNPLGIYALKYGCRVEIIGNVHENPELLEQGE